LCSEYHRERERKKKEKKRKKKATPGMIVFLGIWIASVSVDALSGSDFLVS
jgi:hypothetical protein